MTAALTSQNGTTMTEVATRAESKPAVSLDGRMGDLDQAWRMSQALAQSALLPQALRNKPSDVLVTILYGQEIGLSPDAGACRRSTSSTAAPPCRVSCGSRRSGRPATRSSSSPTDKEATCTITRSDTRTTRTPRRSRSAEAEKAKLTSKDVWKQYPKRMLGWRAVSNCATVACPEVALGFEMTELVQAEQASTKPTLAEVAQQREPQVDTATGEIHEAEVVDDDAIRQRGRRPRTAAHRRADGRGYRRAERGSPTATAGRPRVRSRGES
jgi:hypothetical protein